ncbi:MAG: hypothetical protein ACLTBD_09080 [Clostridia bacterium]
MSQLIEQIVRVASVYVIYRVQMGTDSATPAIAVWECVCGEISSALFSAAAVRFLRLRLCDFKNALPKIGRLSVAFDRKPCCLKSFTSIEGYFNPLKTQRGGT